MAINEAKLNKGHLRKLQAMRKSMSKSIGSELGVPAANSAFEKWYETEKFKVKMRENDQVAEKILEALKPFVKDKSFNLGTKGYKITRSKGKGAKGFSVTKL